MTTEIWIEVDRKRRVFSLVVRTDDKVVIDNLLANGYVMDDKNILRKEFPHLDDAGREREWICYNVRKAGLKVRKSRWKLVAESP